MNNIVLFKIDNSKVNWIIVWFNNLINSGKNLANKKLLKKTRIFGPKQNYLPLLVPFLIGNHYQIKLNQNQSSWCCSSIDAIIIEITNYLWNHQLFSQYLLIIIIVMILLSLYFCNNFFDSILQFIAI